MCNDSITVDIRDREGTLCPVPDGFKYCHGFFYASILQAGCGAFRKEKGKALPDKGETVSCAYGSGYHRMYRDGVKQYDFHDTFGRDVRRLSRGK